MLRKDLIRGAINYYITNNLNITIGNYENQIKQYESWGLDTEGLEKSLEVLQKLRDDYFQLLKEL